MWSYFYSHYLLLRGTHLPQTKDSCLLSVLKNSQPFLFKYPFSFTLRSFLLLEYQNVGLSLSLLSLLGSHYSSLYLSMPYLGHLPQVHFSNPLAPLINLSTEVLISMTTCFVSRSSVGSFSKMHVFFFFCSVLFVHYEV